MLKKDSWTDLVGHRQFYVAATEEMRCTVIDRIRKKTAVKRGGEFDRHEFNEELAFAYSTFEDHPDLLDVNDALEKLKLEDPEAYETTILRFFLHYPTSELRNYME